MDIAQLLDPNVEDLLWELREGTLALAQALADPLLAERHAHEIIGHAMIGAGVYSPGLAALELTRAASIEHGTLVCALSTHQLAVLEGSDRILLAA